MICSIKELRSSIKKNKPSIGTWMQIPSPDIAEILSAANSYDWIVIDMEHGSFSRNNLSSIVRAIEINSVLPFVRLQSNKDYSVKSVIDCGFKGFIVPMTESAEELEIIFDQFCYPPLGKRGVGFSRSNQFGINFKEKLENQDPPFLVAMIETMKGIENIDNILNYKNIDAIIIGPYDLSASLDICGQFENRIFIEAYNFIIKKCKENNIPYGIHLIEPSNKKLEETIKNGSTFIPYSIDAVMLHYLKPISQ